jgi:hypothetical protein
MAATLGVGIWSYASYAVFSYVSTLLTVVLAYKDSRVLRLPPASATAGVGLCQPAAGPHELN